MMEVRRYRAGDHDAVWDLHNVALNEVGAHMGNGPWDDDLHHIEADTFSPEASSLWASSTAASSRWERSNG